MPRQIIDLGTLALNGADGDTNRDANAKVNANFLELYGANQNFVRGPGNVQGGELAVFAGTTGNQLAAATGGAPGTAAFKNAAEFASASQGTKADNAEPAITAGQDGQYWSGNKTWRDFAQSVTASILNGYQAGINAVVLATDSVMQAIGKLQGQITERAMKGQNNDITALSALSTAITVAQGGTGSNNPAGARAALGVDVTLASAALDPQTSNGLMSSVVVNGWVIDKFLNGTLVMSGNYSTPTFPASAPTEFTFPIPSGVADQGSAQVLIGPAPYSSVDYYAPVAFLNTLTSVLGYMRNGATPQRFEFRVKIIGRWK